MVPAPGHYAGHTAVVARDDGITYFFSGDAGYTLEDMLAGRTDGVTNDPLVSLATIRKIVEFAAMEPTVVLPAHDPDASRRLHENDLVNRTPRSSRTRARTEPPPEQTPS